MSTFASTLSSLASTASKRDFESAISGEHPHVVDVGVHGVVLSAAMPLSRQEQATTYLRRRVPLRLERLLAWNMRVRRVAILRATSGRTSGDGRATSSVACRYEWRGSVPTRQARVAAQRRRMGVAAPDIGWRGRIGWRRRIGWRGARIGWRRWIGWRSRAACPSVRCRQPGGPGRMQEARRRRTAAQPWDEGWIVLG